MIYEICLIPSLFMPQAVPSRTTWRRPLMVRQPYSVAVPSTGGRLHPLPFWKGRGLGSGLRTPSSQEGDRGVEKNLRYDHRREKSR